MKLIKSCLALVLGMSLLCCGSVMLAPSKVGANADVEADKLLQASNEAKTATQDEELYQTADHVTCMGNKIVSNAVYMATQSQLDMDQIPGSIKASHIITYKNYYPLGGDCVDIVRKGSTIYSLPIPESDLFTFGGWYVDEKCISPYNLGYASRSLVSQNVDIYAKWVYKVSGSDYYKLTFSIKDENNQKTVCPVYVGLRETIPLPQLKRSGYIFNGWFSTMSYIDKLSDEFTVNQNRTIYAYWTEDPSFDQEKYTVIYHTNMGDGSTISSEKMTKDSVVSSAPTLPSRVDYTFEGWYLDSEFTKPVLVNGNGIIVGDYADEEFNLHLFAKWTQVVEQNVSIVFYKNYTTTDTEQYQSVVVNKNDIIYSLPTPTRDGYTFGGWYLDRGTTQPFVISESGYTVTQNVVVYAKWIQDTADKVSIVLYRNASQSDEYIYSTQTVEKNSVIYVLPTPTLVNKDFAGWYYDRECTQSLVIPQSGFIVSSNMELYAKWSDSTVETVKITYYKNYNASSPNSDPYSIESYKKGDKILSTPTPTRSGYIFGGWYLDSECTNPFVIPEGGQVINSSFVVYAKWSVDDGKVSLVLYRNYYEDDYYIVSSQKILKNDRIYSLPTLSREGYTFGGWYLDKACSQAFVIPQAGFVFTSDLSLYANWIEGEQQSYVITYYHNYSAEDDTQLGTKTVQANDKLLATPTIERLGYIFEGWYTDKACTQEFVIPAGGYIVTSNMSLYAKWTAFKDEFVFTLYRNYYEDDNSTILSKIVLKNEKIYSLNNLVREGYWFDGWYLDRACTIKFEIPATGYAFTSNLSLYAKWVVSDEPTVVTISYFRNYAADDDTKIASRNYQINDKVTQTPAPSRSGYTFEGWYYDRECTQAFTIPASGYTITSSFNLYAKWSEEKVELRLILYRNYFEDEYYVVSSQKILKNDKIYSLPTLTRDGYTFGGWYSDKACVNKPFVIPQDGYVMTTNLALYAKWVCDEPQTVVVTYFNNYTSTDTTQFESFTYQKDEKIFSTPTPTRSGYTFEGWYLDRACTIGFVIPAPGRVISSNLSIYAKWSEEKVELRLTLYRNYSEDEYYAITVQKVYKNDRIYSLPMLVRDGYIFGGWYLDKACVTSPFVIPDDGYVMTTNIALYAKWTKVEPQTVVVTYYNNYTSTDTTQFEVSTYQKDTKLILTPTPTRSGYTFEGWYLDRACTISFVIPASGHVLSSNLSLYAKWSEERVELNLVLYRNYYEDEYYAISSQKIYKNDKFYSLPTLTRDGYTFGGWYLDKACVTNPFVIPQDGYVMTTNLALYAKWTKVEPQTVVVTYYNNYASTDTTQFEVSTYQKDTKLILTPTPTRSGYTFEGWYLDRACTISFVIPESGHVLSSNLSLYAKWSEEKVELRLILYRNYYEDEYYAISSQKIYKNDKFYSLPTLTRDGYTFGGWYLDKACVTNPFVIPQDGYVMTTNLALYAKWDRIVESVTITLYKNFTSSDTSQYDAVVVEKNSSIYSLPIPTRVNYTFGGWYLDRACTVSYTIPATGQIVSTNVALYAKWDRIVEEKVTITLYKNSSATDMVQFNPVTIVKGSKLYSLPDGYYYGHIFDGWYLDRACSQPFIIPESGIEISSDLALYAKWKEEVQDIVTLTRIVPKADGTCSEVKSTMQRGCVITSLGICQDLTRAFEGWYLDSKYTQPFDVGSGYKMNSDLTLYAKFINYPAGDVNRDGKINYTDVFLLKYYIRANSTTSREDKALRDVNYDGKVDRFDIHTLDAYIWVNEKTGSALRLANQRLIEKNLDLNSDGVVNQKDLDIYKSKRVESSLTDPTTSSKYVAAYDLNADGSINAVDDEILKLIADNDSNLIDLLK